MNQLDDIKPVCPSTFDRQPTAVLEAIVKNQFSVERLTNYNLHNANYWSRAWTIDYFRIITPIREFVVGLDHGDRTTVADSVDVVLRHRQLNEALVIRKGKIYYEPK